MELDVVEMIIAELDYNVLPQGEYKLYMELHKSRCKEYIATSCKYKERVMLLQAMYKAIKADLLFNVHIQVNKHKGVVEVEDI